MMAALNHDPVSLILLPVTYALGAEHTHGQGITAKSEEVTK